jgi:Flp pilus assembly protein TadD
MRTLTVRVLLASTVLLSIAACEHFPLFTQQAKIKTIPADMPKGSGETVVDRLYAQAVRAIDRREYDTALDILQLANGSRNEDARVLNALGVIYDKLGRFDLSTRYYDLAEKADPGSKVVAINRRYSLVLQQAGPRPGASDVMMAANLPRTASVAIAAPTTAPGPLAAAASPRPPAAPGPAPAAAPALVATVRPPAAQPAVAATLVATRAQPLAAGQASRPPVSIAPRPPAVSEDELYRRAVVSIQHRSFGEALGILTQARAMAPKDPRVLSAMGVVYDWLGRFDLSARCYDLAEAADPGSVVVAINRRYSNILQHHGGALVANQVVMPRDASSSPVRVEAASAGPPSHAHPSIARNSAPAATRKTALRAPTPRPASRIQESHAG